MPRRMSFFNEVQKCHGSLSHRPLPEWDQMRGGGVVKGIKEVQKGLLARASQISRETNNNDNVIYLKAPTMPGTSTVINALEILSNLTS